MKDISSVESLVIPEGVTVVLKARSVTVTGPRGTLTKNVRHIQMDMQIVKTAKQNKVVFTIWHGARKHVACLRTVKSLVENMIIGVTKGFQYKMRLVYAHFPINAIPNDDGSSLQIRNFLGEKIVRDCAMLEGTKVSLSDVKDEIILEGNDIEKVSQSAASITDKTRVKDKDGTLHDKPRYVVPDYHGTGSVMAPTAPRFGAKRRDRDAKRRSRGITDEDITSTFDNAVQAFRKIRAPTIHMHKKALERFEEFVDQQIRTGNIKKVLNSPVYPRGHPECLEDFFLSDAPVIDIPTLHAFAYHYASGATGIDGGEVSVTSVILLITSFYGAYMRKRGEKIPHRVMASAENYVKGKLADELHLSTATREKLTPTKETILLILKGCWLKAYKPDCTRSRFQTALYTLIALSGGSRSGSIVAGQKYDVEDYDPIEQALKYGDCSLRIRRDPKGGPNQLLVVILARHGKTRQSENKQIPLLPHETPALSGPFMFTYLATLDGVLRGDPTITQLLDPASLGSLSQREIAIKDEFKDLTVFRAIAGVRSPTPGADLPWGNREINDQYLALCQVLGFEGYFTSHALRRVVMQTLEDNNVSGIRIQHEMGHKLYSDTTSLYLGAMIRTDPAGLLFGMGDRSDIIADLTQIKFQFDPGAPQALSTEERRAIYQIDEVRAVFDAQRAEKARLSAIYGHPSRSTLDEQLHYRQLYNDAMWKYRAYHDSRLKDKRNAYYDGLREISGDASSSNEGDDQFKGLDAPPPGELCEWDAEEVEKFHATKDIGSLEFAFEAGGDEGMIALDKLHRVDDAESFRQATDAMRQIVLHGHHSFDLDSGAILRPSTAVTDELQSLTSDNGIGMRSASGASSSSKSFTPPLHNHAVVPQTSKGKGKRPRSPSVDSMASDDASPTARARSSAPSFASVSTTPATSRATSILSSSSSSSRAPSLTTFERAVSLLWQNGGINQDVMTACLALPSKMMYLTGFMPTGCPTSDDRCPICDIYLPDAIQPKSPKSKVNEKKRRLTHIENCERKEAVRQDEHHRHYPVDVGQCPARGCDSSVSFKAPALKDHLLNSHASALSLIWECKCGTRLLGSTNKYVVHLARHHRIFVPPASVKIEDNKLYLPDEAFSRPSLHLATGRYYVDPIVEDEACKAMYEEWFREDTWEHQVAPRSDWDFRITATTYRRLLQTKEDLTYLAVFEDPNCASIKFGLCYFCAHDISLPWCERVQTYNETNMVLHYTMCFRKRFGPYFPSINGGNPISKKDLAFLAKLRTTGTRAAPVQHDHDIAPENFSVLKDDKGSWFCQDPRCHRTFKEAFLLVNHLVEYHRIYIRADSLKEVGGRRALGDKSKLTFNSDADMEQAMTLRQGPGITPPRSYLVPPPSSQIQANGVRMSRLTKEIERVAACKARLSRTRRRALAKDRSGKYDGEDSSGEDSIGEETEDELELEYDSRKKRFG